MLKLLSAFCILFLLFTSSCQTYSDWFGPPFTIQTLSLFNQRTDVLEGTQKTWKGDWLFRRKRSQLVDDAINKKSPNIIFFQEMMEKSSKSDSDATILGYSSLAYHQPFFFPYKKYKETGEKESAAIYIRMGNHNIESETQNPIIALENNGYVSFQKILLNNVPFYLINIKMG